MPALTIEKQGLTFIFSGNRTLGVTLRLADFAKLEEPRLTDPSYQKAADIIMLCSAYTLNITGDGALATFWAQYGKQRASALWEGAIETLTDNDLSLWWAAYDAVREKPERADFLAESAKPTDLQSPSQSAEPE